LGPFDGRQEAAKAERTREFPLSKGEGLPRHLHDHNPGIKFGVQTNNFGSNFTQTSN
jgi:hypothetical protein